jgi:predicted transcriptional regulator
MSNLRSRLEIMLCVLSVVMDGVEKPTWIMYAVNLSWVSTQGILARLVEQDLLREREEKGNRRSRRRYEITERGENVLRYFGGAKELINIKEIIT